MKHNFIERVSRKLVIKYGHHVASRRRGAVASVAKICRWFLNAYENNSYQCERNGESMVVNALRLPPGANVVDVGANRGEYTDLLLLAYPEANIHSFEVLPEMCDQLRARFGAAQNVVIHQKGLGENGGKADFHKTPGVPELTSVYRTSANASQAPLETVQAEIVRGDSYFDQIGIEELFFVKIDTEGHDLSVVKSFYTKMKDCKLHSVQFEYNEASIAARVFLKDFFTYFESFGFRIGKIFPNVVEFGPYEFHLEDHRASNYLAVAPTPSGQAIHERLCARYNR